MIHRHATCVRVALLVVSIASAPGCLVLNMNPVYEEDTIGWDPALVGSWRNADDNVTVTIEADEWRSYRIHYEHPIESGDLTAFLTFVGDERYLDVMPVRGKDHGAFLIPVHASLRVRLAADRLEVTPLSYDWLVDLSRDGVRVPQLTYVLERKQNVMILSPTAALRTWLRRQPPDGQMFGASAVFVRSSR